MAEFLRRCRPPEYCGTHRYQPWHEPHRGALRPLRCAFRPRVSRWPRTERFALLHGLGLARLQTEEVDLQKERTMEVWACGPSNRVGMPGTPSFNLTSSLL